MKNGMNFVYASDDDYAFLAGVSIFSLLKKNQGAEKITIHFLDDGISASNREKLIETVETFQREIIFYDVRARLDELKSRVGALAVFSPNGGAKKSYSAYARLTIGELLPREISRVVYVDCDTFVADDLNELFAMPLQHAIAMALDCSHVAYKKFLGFAKTDRYFNSGVIVFDLAKWRAEKWMEKIFAFTRQNSRIFPFADQDYLNVVLKGKIDLLPCRYNFTSPLFLYTPGGLNLVYAFDAENPFFAKNELRAAQKKSAIYHFCGTVLGRPFYRNSCSPIKAAYDAIYFESPWRTRAQDALAYSRVDRVRNLLFRFTPKWFAACVGFFAMKFAMRLWKTR